MELLTIDEVAELLRVSRNRVTLLAQRGEIPTVRVMGRFRFDAKEIEDWFKANRPTSQKAGANPHKPRAIVEWPNGLSSPAMVFPIGDSIEQTQEIMALLKELCQENQPNG